MHIRDLPDIADLSAETQLDDEIVEFVAPLRQKYYNSYRNGFVRRIYARSLRPGWVYWVAETDKGDEPTALQKSNGEREFGGRIIGYAAWTRVGKSPVANNWLKMNEAWFTKLESYLADLKNSYWNLFNLDWSQDPAKRDILTELFAQTFGEDIFPEAWLLANVVVHKDYQRRGIGARLVRWGLDQAEDERVPCGVESSSAGLRLYEKLGFRKFDDMRYGEKEKETMPLMVWEPNDLQGHWFDKAKAMADEKGRDEPSRFIE